MKVSRKFSLIFVSIGLLLIVFVVGSIVTLPSLKFKRDAKLFSQQLFGLPLPTGTTRIDEAVFCGVIGGNGGYEDCFVGLLVRSDLDFEDIYRWCSDAEFLPFGANSSQGDADWIDYGPVKNETSKIIYCWTNSGLIGVEAVIDLAIEDWQRGNLNKEILSRFTKIRDTSLDNCYIIYIISETGRRRVF